MADQTLDPRFESLLRAALAAEAGKVSLTITGEQVVDHALARRAGGATIRHRAGAGFLDRAQVNRFAVQLSAVAGVVIFAALALGIYVSNPRPGIGNPPSPTPTDSPTLTVPAVNLGIFRPLAGRIVYGGGLGLLGVDPAAPTNPVMRVPLASDAGTALGWSSDGTRLLTTREEGLFVLQADGSETQLTRSPMTTRGAAISPDGSRVVFAGSTNPTEGCCAGWALYSVDANGGPAEKLVESRNGILEDPAFSPDGTRIAYDDGVGDNNHHVWVIDADGSNAHEIASQDCACHVYGIAWSPVGDRIAMAVEGTIYTFAPDGSQFTAVITNGDFPYWSSDASQLAYTTTCLANANGCGLGIADADGSDAREFASLRSGPWHPGPIELPLPTTAPDVTAHPSGAPTVPASPSRSPAPDPSAQRRTGEFIVFQSSGTSRGWDLAAQDPESGNVRPIVATDHLVDCAAATRCTNFVRKAEWSADGAWVAFEISNASLDGPQLGACGPAIGIWVQGPNGGPRQLTTPCDEPPPADEPVAELWEWSPVKAQLAYVRIDGETDQLFVINALDGTRTSLASGNVDPPYPVDSESLVWSPDGSRIGYVDGTSVYTVDVESGERSLVADSFEDIIDIAWARNGTKILVLDQGRYRIQVLGADGSDRHVLLQGEDACCDVAWSPNGSRIAYALSLLFPGEPQTGRFYSELWTVEPDGSNPIKVFDGATCPNGVTDASPAWAPNGRQVAYLGCSGWLVENADATGDMEGIDERVWRSWFSSGLTERDLAGIGQIDH